MDFNNVKEVFDRYVDTFKTDDKRKEMKRFHTYEVAEISYLIANKLGLTEEKRDLAKLIGYLHDIGRFPQLVDTHSFKDINYDHADKGIEVLFDDNLIREFIKSDKYDKLIEFSVKYHNKLSLPDEMTKDGELFGKIIRDADKVDIYRVVSERDDNDFLLPPSKKVVESFMSGLPVDLKDKKNKSDSTLCVIAFINDINYQESLDILEDYGYFDNYLKSVNVSDENKELFNEILEVCKVRKKVKNVR